MTTQNIIAVIIVLAAAGYIGSLLLKRLRSFSPAKTSCGDDCGCGSAAADKAAK